MLRFLYGFAMLFGLSACTIGSVLQKKSHLLSQDFIPLNDVPFSCVQNTLCSFCHYCFQKRVLEKERNDLKHSVESELVSIDHAPEKCKTKK
jgi:hypothetical protein